MDSGFYLRIHRFNTRCCVGSRCEDSWRVCCSPLLFNDQQVPQIVEFGFTNQANVLENDIHISLKKFGVFFVD